jgi:hypothetical protein
MVDSHFPPPRAQQSRRGMAIGDVTLPLLTAFQRLIDLLAERTIFRFLRRSSSGKSCTDYS